MNWNALKGFAKNSFKNRTSGAGLAHLRTGSVFTVSSTVDYTAVGKGFVLAAVLGGIVGWEQERQ